MFSYRLTRRGLLLAEWPGERADDGASMPSEMERRRSGPGCARHKPHPGAAGLKNDTRIHTASEESYILLVYCPAYRGQVVSCLGLTTPHELGWRLHPQGAVRHLSVVMADPRGHLSYRVFPRLATGLIHVIPFDAAEQRFRQAIRLRTPQGCVTGDESLRPARRVGTDARCIPAHCR